MNSNFKILPKVSIIIPAYNCQNTIKKAISSLVNQTYDNLEILVINDGSTDNTNDIVNSIMSLDDRIIYYKNNNQGVSETRNFGLSKASGDFVMFLDSDDYYMQNTIEICINNIVSSNSDLLIFGMVFNNVSDGIKTIKGIKSDITMEIQDLRINFEHFYTNNLISSCWNKMYRTNYAKKIFFDKSISTYEDLLYVVEYLSICEKIHLIKEPLYVYNITKETSLSKKYKKTMYEEICSLEKKLVNFYKVLGINDLDFVINQKYFFSVIIINNLIKSPKNKKDIISDLKKTVESQFLVAIINSKRRASLKNRMLRLIYSMKSGFILYYVFKLYYYLRRAKNCFTTKKTS